jgi:MFS family permease
MVSYKTTFSIASIMALRMLGLFMVMPLLALYLIQLPGSTPVFLGVAMGIYGLTQASFQMPFGIFSDFYGRKIAIFLGLFIFIIGSLIAGCAHTIVPLIIGRMLQGAGAIGSTLMALLSDLTDESYRAQAMAIMGGVIGLSFSFSIVAGPMLNSWLSVPGIFFLSVGMGIIAIGILLTAVPTPEQRHVEKFSFADLIFKLKQLWMQKNIRWINASGMLLHMLLVMSFISVPISLSRYVQIASNHHWKVYLPVLLLSFAIALKWIMLTQRKPLTPSMVCSVGFIALSQIVLLFFHHYLWGISIGLLLFFVGFNFLEAVLPSEISKKAGTVQRGMAMGLYSTIQFSGIFLGGLLGGIIYSYFSINGIFILSTSIAAIWLILGYQQMRRIHFN